MNKELENLRRDIDELDKALGELLSKRAATAKAIGKAKGSAPVYDPLREQEVIRKLIANCPELPPGALETIQREIIGLCRSLQELPVVACLGPEGSFSHHALKTQFGSGARPLFCGDFSEVLATLHRGEAEMALLPMENTVEGAVCPALDALVAAPQEYKALWESRIPIRHMLAGKTPLEDITTVCSHPQALSQCRRWIAAHIPGRNILPLSSTSAAAEYAAGHPGTAAVCTLHAAEQQKLEVLAKNIQDSPHNMTRFWTIGTQKARRGEKNKTSFMLTLPHTPGSLFSALAPIGEVPLNMTFIQSRPLLHNPFEYSFFVDVEGHLEEPQVKEAIDKVRSRATGFRLLGSYPVED